SALSEHVRGAARRDRTVFVDARRCGDQVLVGVSYAPVDLKQDIEALLDPFASNEDSRTGRPASLALYVVRRLVEAHGGTVSVTGQGDQRSIQLSLRALGHRTNPEHGPVEQPPAPRDSSAAQPVRRR